MTPLAPHLEAFFRTHLSSERACSRHTCEAYAYAFQLLVSFAAKRHKTSPSGLSLEQLNAPLVLDFLTYLETTRRNSPATRNARLTAIKSFAHFIEYRVPAAIDQVRRILGIPAKRTDLPLVDYLTSDEVRTLLDAPEPTTRLGIRDRAMLHLCFAAGLRVSELIGLTCTELRLHPDASVHVHGKGRRERVLPLWKQTTAALRAWLAVRGNLSTQEVFVNAHGRPLSRSGVEYILDKHVRKAAVRSPSIASKRVSPHVLRHSCAMHTLQATRDVRKVSLWLGHASVKSTEIYLARIRRRSSPYSPPPPHQSSGRVASDHQTDCWRCCDSLDSGLVMRRSDVPHRSRGEGVLMWAGRRLRIAGSTAYLRMSVGCVYAYTVTRRPCHLDRKSASSRAAASTSSPSTRGPSAVNRITTLTLGGTGFAAMMCTG
jgi:integrase/recombinase XerD